MSASRQNFLLKCYKLGNFKGLTMESETMRLGKKPFFSSKRAASGIRNGQILARRCSRAPPNPRADRERTQRTPAFRRADRRDRGLYERFGWSHADPDR